ncbi:carboxypeptidase Y [Sarocladium strictum]
MHSPWLLLLACVGASQALPSIQLPLTGPAPTRERSSAQGVPFTVREQGPELCDAGSRHWTGTVNVTQHKSIFFWYFESRHQPSEAPVILWLSGGPGASGELGNFLDIGSCTVNPDANSTSRRDHSWTDVANVIFIDQPAGVGFSHVDDRDDIPVTLYDGAQDLHTFLSTFTSQIFPEIADRALHITGESMAGHYVTAYTKHIISRQHESRYGSGLAPLNIKSAVIVDGYIDGSAQSSGYYDFFCTDWRGDGRESPLMNDTACDEMEAAVPQCERLGSQCRATYDQDLCQLAFAWCEEHVGKFFHADVKPGGWNPYDNRESCIEPPLCFDLDEGVTERFLNQEWVQDRLGFSNVSFSLIDFDVGERWVGSGKLFLPVTRELSWLLDETDLGVLVINGNNDIIVNTPGQIRLLDTMPWSRQASYRAAPVTNWYYMDAGIIQRTGQGELASSAALLGGTSKGDDRLKLVTVDDAGHFVPLHQPVAVLAILKDWLKDH